MLHNKRDDLTIEINIILVSVYFWTSILDKASSVETYFPSLNSWAGHHLTAENKNAASFLLYVRCQVTVAQVTLNTDLAWAWSRRPSPLLFTYASCTCTSYKFSQVDLRIRNSSLILEWLSLYTWNCITIARRYGYGPLRTYLLSKINERILYL